MSSKKPRKKQLPDKNNQQKRRHIAAGIFVMIFAILLVAAFVDYHPQQTKFVSTRTYASSVDSNIFGAFGANFVFFSMRYLGLSAWLIPVMTGIIACIMFWPPDRKNHVRRSIAMLLVFVSAAGMCDCAYKNWMTNCQFLAFSKNQFSAGLGGIVGEYVFSRHFDKFFGKIGSFAIFLTIFLMSSLYVCTRCTSLNSALENKFRQYGHFHAIIWSMVKWILLKIKNFALFFLKKIFCFFTNIFRRRPHDDTNDGTDSAPEKEPDIVEMPYDNVANVTENVAVPDDAGVPLKVIGPHDDKKLVVNPPIEPTRPNSQPVTVLTSSKGQYVLPPIDLLQSSKATQNTDDHLAVSKQLVDTLSEFGISVRAGEVHIGPVITRYEILPAPGVRVEKIANLDKNIALNLRAQSVRILAPVPGRGCVGVELPNKNPQMVCLREILESAEWADMHADIPIVLGRGTTGEPMINDLAKMPHLLIAGSTGSGKTVCINAIIASLVYHATPDDLRFIMVDPKIVEMQMFNNLPHMLIPVVTDPKKVPNALKWLISEMESRYKIFAAAGVRNIAGFNAKVLRDAAESEHADEIENALSPEERSAINDATVDKNTNTVDIPKKKIPYIVCIIDELADLMMVAPADIETSVARLAQLARAAGIHLILATQRPSVNVITGIIKANLPSRIAFKVASKIDSRTILDAGGADTLLGRGDMLFQPPGASGLLRAQGALVSDDEITNIVEFLREKNGAPEYAMDVHSLVESGDSDDSSDGEEFEDELTQQALEILQNCDHPSVSLLQRRLRIGYNRAARIYESLPVPPAK